MGIPESGHRKLVTLEGGTDHLATLAAPSPNKERLR